MYKKIQKYLLSAVVSEIEKKKETSLNELFEIFFFVFVNIKFDVMVFCFLSLVIYYCSFI